MNPVDFSVRGTYSISYQAWPLRGMYQALGMGRGMWHALDHVVDDLHNVLDTLVNHVGQ